MNFINLATKQPENIEDVILRHALTHKPVQWRKNYIVDWVMKTIRYGNTVVYDFKHIEWLDESQENNWKAKTRKQEIELKQLRKQLKERDEKKSREKKRYQVKMNIYGIIPDFWVETDVSHLSEEVIGNLIRGEILRIA